jgi:toxin ParE1/3/4
VNVKFRADAQRELNAACDYIENARPGYGALFAERVARELSLIAEFPRVGKELLPGVRRRTMSGWSHSIIYLLRDDTIYVVAVAHYRRDERYWLPRIRETSAR